MKQLYSIKAKKTINKIQRVIIDGLSKLKVTYGDGRIRIL